MLFVVPPPSVMELGNVTGFDFMLMDRAGVGHELLAARNQLLGAAARARCCRACARTASRTRRSTSSTSTAKARALGVAVSDINNTLATAWGSSYVNDFIDRGRVKKVFVQGDASARMLPRTWRNGTCATRTATWFRSRPSRLPAGPTARRS